MSQKGISDLYDTYLRIIEIPSKYNLNRIYIQGKLPIVVNSTTKSANNMTEVAIPVDLSIDEESGSDKDDDVSEVKWVPELLCFVDCEVLNNLDADIFVNSKMPAALSSHATAAAKLERTNVQVIRNTVNKIFNKSCNMQVFNACQNDFESPLSTFNVFPVLMEFAAALKFIFVSICKMKNVKTNKLFDRLHDTLKNSRHNKVTKKVKVAKDEDGAETAELVAGPAPKVAKTRHAPPIKAVEHRKGTANIPAAKEKATLPTAKVTLV